MNLKELETIILTPASSIRREMGKELLKKGLVSSVKGRNIENTYHIYGNVSNEINHKELSTHIKLNLKNKKLEGVRCTCDDFKEFSKNQPLFMCEHLTGTVYKFLSLMNKRRVKKQDLTDAIFKNKIKKTGVGIDTKIIHKLWKGVTTYKLEFRIGINHKHLIRDLKKFIHDYDDGKYIYFNNEFIYNPNEHSISQSYIKIIDFIRKYDKKDDRNYISGRNIILHPNELRGFLECAAGNKVQLKYNGIEYNSTVLMEDLPLSFTLKEDDEHFKLTTHKRFPIPLNEDNSVYLFNNEIYLPSQNQIKRYLILYPKLKKYGKILFHKNMENYNKIISLISSISKDIILSEDVRKFAADSSKLEFLIYKEEENIYCSVYATYNNEKINILKKGSRKTQLIRDFKMEEKALMKLEYYKFIRREDRLLFIGDDEDIFNIMNKKENIITSLGTLILGKGFENVKIYDGSSIKIDLYEEDEYFKFNYAIGDVDRDELPNIFQSYKKGSRFYKTKDNKFIDLEDEDIQNFFSLIETLNLEEKLDDGYSYIAKSKALYMAEKLKNREYKFGWGSELLDYIEKRETGINNEAPIPKNLKAKLREYQVKGFRWLKGLSELGLGGILADEMGLGKTIQTIAFLLSEKNKKSLIITPTSLIYNWKSEIERFAPSLKVGIIHGSTMEQAKAMDALDEYDLILTTYGTLRNNIDRYKDLIFDYCIIDEAQNIKNPLSQSTLAVKMVNAKVKFALTGTPIENNLMELWSIFDFIMPGYLYSREVFHDKFILDEDSNLEGLRLMIKPFILRRTKSEVIEDLPDKIEKKILVEMTPKQKAVYKAYIKNVRERIKNDLDGNIPIFSYLTRLRQICLEPSLVFNEYKGGSGKIKIALDLVEENIDSGGKTLLFSQFTSALKIIGETLKEREIKYYYLDGATSSKERIRLVNEFNKSSKVKVFLISLKAGGTGLNLTSANLVIHFDPWWNPAVENQATDRAHRIGQKNVVEVVKLVSRGTIEEKIVLLQEEKKELAHNVLTRDFKEGIMLNRLSREELIDLFCRE